MFNELLNKTNDPGDNDFNLISIFSSLTGGKTEGFDLGSLPGGGLQGSGSPGAEQNKGIESIFYMLKYK